MKLWIEYKGQKIKYPLCKYTFCYKWHLIWLWCQITMQALSGTLRKCSSQSEATLQSAPHDTEAHSRTLLLTSPVTTVRLQSSWWILFMKKQNRLSTKLLQDHSTRIPEGLPETSGKPHRLCSLHSINGQLWQEQETWTVRRTVMESKRDYRKKKYNSWREFIQECRKSKAEVSRTRKWKWDLNVLEYIPFFQWPHI